MSVIKPTVGRKVWYWPSTYDKTGPVPMTQQTGQPLDATVIAVHSDRMVNVLVVDVMGRQFPVLSCDLLQPGDPVRASESGQVIGRYVEWMPFQVGHPKAKEEWPEPSGIILTDADAAADLAGTPRPDHPSAEVAHHPV